MNSNEISKILRRCKITRNKFKGVFSSENMPKKSTYFQTPFCFVVNTDPSWLPGAHWVAIFVDQDQKIEFFDSFGRRPMTQHLKNFCGREYTFNERIIQSLTSNVCGQYCIYFLYNRCSGKSFSRIMKCFNPNTAWINDRIVKSFVYSKK